MKSGFHIWVVALTFFLVGSCKNDDPEMVNDTADDTADEVITVELPKRAGSRPETTTDIPHVQIDVELVPEVNEELNRRVYSIPGIEERPSVVAGWQGIWITEDVSVVVPEALIGDREFAHIHNDGSLHIFLEPSRSNEAVESCWAVLHPFAVQRLEGYDGFVMLYTPQTLDELDVTFQLIVDGYNYVTGQSLLATDYP
ncbi:MAG: luciferase family protein [Reichenbachiella sp.]|uniref:luciferase domain-containing protein n=1 Tax=Reichenbachiella sp. TaxID=2184521 RepID=UPI003266B9F9